MEKINYGDEMDIEYEKDMTLYFNSEGYLMNKKNSDSLLEKVMLTSSPMQKMLLRDLIDALTQEYGDIAFNSYCIGRSSVTKSIDNNA